MILSQHKYGTEAYIISETIDIQKRKPLVQHLSVIYIGRWMNGIRSQLNESNPWPPFREVGLFNPYVLIKTRRIQG